jgi:hypothetical protein
MDRKNLYVQWIISDPNKYMVWAYVTDIISYRVEKIDIIINIRVM